MVGARHEHRLLGVACRPMLRLSKNPQTEKISAHNSFVFQRRFSVNMPKLDFFDSLVRRTTWDRLPRGLLRPRDAGAAWTSMRRRPSLLQRPVTTSSVASNVHRACQDT